MFILSRHVLNRALAICLANASVSAWAADNVAPGCEKYFEAAAVTTSVPYRVSQTMMVDGKAMNMEAISINGIIYTRSAQLTGGQWRANRVLSTASLVAMAKQTTRQCSAAGIEPVGSTPTRVWITKSKTPFDSKVTEGKVWVGIADGRIYRQADAEMDQRYSYDNVVAPSVPVPPEKKKR